MPYYVCMLFTLCKISISNAFISTHCSLFSTSVQIHNSFQKKKKIELKLKYLLTNTNIGAINRTMLCADVVQSHVHRITKQQQRERDREKIVF